jgi:pantetheine-phosphate adenylyltransferase
MHRIALYPGSFDPLTNGHVNIIERGLALCDELVVAIVHNPNKAPMFSVEERMQILREVFPDEQRVRLTTFSGLLVNYAREVQASAILRGLRAVADFEYESQMANMNRRLAPEVETVFLMAEPGSFFVSSRLVKEVALLGGDISGSVPPQALARLTAKVRQLQGKGA